MIKQLWQFPAVIGGTALLTFCGVSALQASINAPLHAFGAVVEAARASTSASVSPTLVAAPPVQKLGGGAQATPGSPQIQAAAAAPTSRVPQAAPAPAPLPVAAPAAPHDDQGSQSAQGGGSAQGNQGQGDQGQNNQGKGTAGQGGQGQGSQSQVDQSQGDQGQGNSWGAGNGQSTTVTLGWGSASGAGQASGQQGRELTQASSTGSQSANAQGQLASELNRWLGLVDPNDSKGAQGASSGGTGKSGAGSQNSQQ
ncbi:MAG TPA: hypothetical protein VJQ61_06845 [Sinomonas sp.]|nr:hypothetical protein [Sinomonas sp.]